MRPAKKEVQYTKWETFLKQIKFFTKDDGPFVIYTGKWKGYDSSLRVSKQAMYENFDDKKEILIFVTKTIAKDIMKKVNGTLSKYKIQKEV